MQSFTLDRATPVMTMALSSDTGSSATDKYTSNPAVKGTGDPNALVTIKQGTTTLGTTTASSTGSWSFTPTGLVDGLHTLTANETDLAGNTGATTLTFTLDKTAATVTMALSSDTGSSATDKITSNPAVKGTGLANALVTVKQGTTVLGTPTADGTGAWSFTPTGFADGLHTLTASETDLAGNTGSTSLAFTLDTTAPTVGMALVSDTGSSSTDNITSNPAVKGTGPAYTTVTVKEGATILGTMLSSNVGAWSFNLTSLAEGMHTLTASETDPAGNTGSATLTFTLDRAAPAVSMALVSDTGLSAIDRITSNPAVGGFGDPNTLVMISESGTTLGTTMSDITGAWSLTPAGLVDGTHTLTAAETDLAGNTGSVLLSFTLDTHGMTGVA
ncbi:MAG: Ig-like domain-containing protein [Rhodopila sp.]